MVIITANETRNVSCCSWVQFCILSTWEYEAWRREYERCMHRKGGRSWNNVNNSKVCINYC